jgi:hypothetical protein
VDLLDLNGSPEYAMTWKKKRMPSGVPICRLAARARRTSDSDCSGWPTPQANEPESKERPSRAATGRTTEYLGRTVQVLAGYPTPDSSHHGNYRDPNQAGGALPEDANLLTGWPTCVARDAKGRDKRSRDGQRRREGAPSLVEMLWLTGWPTPIVNDGLGSKYTYISGNHDKPALKLPGAVELVTGWPTPQETWGKAGSTSRSGDRKDEPLIGGLARGLSAVQTGRTGACRGVLNPFFSAWLQGYPTEWTLAGLKALSRLRGKSKGGRRSSEGMETPSCRKSRRRS